MRSPSPTLDVEFSLLSSPVQRLGAVDEVGRGSPGGPASCGVVVIDRGIGAVPDGLKDSKQLSAAAREALVPAIETWVCDFAVGHATASEVDEFGLMGALRLAGHRAIGQLRTEVDLFLLDGNVDWLSVPRAPTMNEPDGLRGLAPVITRIKADATCASVAAASVLAKVARDAIMRDLDAQYPGYGWAANKGYASPAHLRALREMGPTIHHRRSWNLPHTA